jgi:acetyltransferase-like isoleucine patch superfamily enzyme
VNAGSVLEDGAIINTSATIEHDCFIGAFAHISSGVVLCGNVSIGLDSHIGAGSVIKQLVNVGNSTMIGIGSMGLHDVPDNSIAYGNPCRVARYL